MQEPMRVCQVVGNMNGGGVEQVVMNYYHHVDRSKVQFDFIVTDSSTIIPKEEMESLGARVFIVPAYTKLPAFESALYDLFREHTEWKIVHSHMNALNVFPLHQAKKAGVPVRISHSHSTAGKGETAKNIVKAILRTQANRYPTHRFACSKFAGEWLFGADMPFEVMYNAIDLSRFWFSETARAKARADLGLVGVEAQAAGLPCLFSDAITREVDVTGKSSFMSIDDPDIWADAFCGIEPKSEAARAVIDCDNFSNYDIEIQGMWLTERYLRLCEEVA